MAQRWRMGRRDEYDDRRHARRYDDRDRDRGSYRPRADRYERDYRRDPRDRSRDRVGDRKRSRSRSPRSYERADRYGHRNDRDYRHDERDKKRLRHDDSHRRSGRDGSRDGRSHKSSSVKDNESPRPSAAEADQAAAAKEDKAKKLAKVEAWKRKLAEQKLAKDGASTQSSPPVIPLPATPSLPITSPDSSALANGESNPSSPAPYTGKFGPKEIQKRAQAKLDKSRSALGGDIVIPKSENAARDASGAKLANNNKVAPPAPVNGINKPAAAPAKISGLGLSKAAADRSDKPTTKAAASGLDDEEVVQRKLEKLPDLPSEDVTGDAALANVEDDQDEGNDLQSDEEQDEAAREAAQKRAQEAQQTEQQDTTMTDGEQLAAVTAGPSTTAENVTPDNMNEYEEVDPLDAFMNDLEKPGYEPEPAFKLVSRKNELQVFNSDDEIDMDAVGDQTDDITAMMAKRKKKDIPPVNHGKIQYESFRRSFYSESVEIAEMTEDEVMELRAELDNIKCRGVDAPKPILKWSQGGFGAQTLDVIRGMKFDKPTSIQSQALPAIMSGRDTIGIAKTGSGKTVAFILPMFRHIKDQRPLESMDGPIGLILAPTRELAVQIHRDCKPYLKALNLRAVCAYGGAPIKDQIAELKRGAEIVVCTPGRLIDLLAANAGRVTNLRRVTYVVLDEADRMFDMGFEPQITKVLNNIRPDRQTVLFSATFPRNMEALARKALNKPIEIMVGGRSVVAPEITQVIEVRREESKFRRLLELLGELHEKDEDARSLIFVEKQETADSLLKEILRKGYPCVSIHGGREQIDRDQAIADFKAGIYPVMVATSVAARGLDVRQLKLVVNYDSPNHGEDYVHRCGRTGRAGNTGTAVTFATPEQDRFAPFLVKALKDSNQTIPESLEKLYEAHQKAVKSGQAKKVGSGFGGKGIERLDAAREAERARERKQYKAGDEPDEEEEKDEKTDAKQSEVDKLVAKAAGGVRGKDDVPPERAAPAASSAPADIVPEALAKHLSDAMKVQKAETPPPTAGGGVGGGRGGKMDPLAKVNAAVASINSRLGAKGSARPGIPADNRGPDAGAFLATLEINDFSQAARWAVTNRTNVAKILEATGTSITNKGNYYPTGKEPEAGDQPKLYILVEGDTEVVVENAMRELTRLLREGTVADLESHGRAQAVGGRYSVV